jgi:DNA-binding NtrC family response regulator
LLVDDDPKNIVLVSRAMVHEGLRVLTAGNAEEALDLLARNTVSVIVADHRMPGMTGVELLRRVKGLWPDVVRVLMSGDIDVRTATEAINQGAVFKVLIKSADFEMLRSSIKDAFAYKALQDDNRKLANRVRTLEAASQHDNVETAQAQPIPYRAVR